MSSGLTIDMEFPLFLLLQQISYKIIYERDATFFLHNKRVGKGKGTLYLVGARLGAFFKNAVATQV